jgi:putative transposase
MRNPLRRYYGRGDLHFVTFSCYRRRPLLGTPRARDRFVKILNEVRSRFAFRLIGYVVMPEHVHLLISEPKTANPSKALQVLKQKVSSALRPQPTKSSTEANSHRLGGSGAHELHFWLRRFYDFNVWSSQKVREKLEDMHANPVKRELVEHPRDWPWSSWSHYENGEEGLIAIDAVIEEEKEEIKIKTRTLRTEGCGTRKLLSPQVTPGARSKRV